MLTITGRRYDTGQTVALEIQDGCIHQVKSAGASGALPWIAPGFVDLQVNGYGGRELTSEEVSVADVAAVARSMDECGVTSFCPTLTTHSRQTLEHALRTIAAACEASPETASRVCGIHLEGPYISPEDGPRGAHPKAHVREPSVEELRALHEASGKRIRILTISPEYDAAPEVIRWAAAAGMIIAIGHTSATHEQIGAAVEAGASMSTHLGNGAHGTIRRHPNYLWSQLAEDRLTASLIADGHHLPAEVVKVMLRAKTPARCVLVSDITGLGGMPPGRYETGLGAVEILENGRLVVAGQRQFLAGAALPIGVGVANVMRFAGLSLKGAVDLASVQPARLIGAPASQFQPGDAADLVLFDLPGADRGALGELSVRATIKRGEVVYGKLGDSK
jgi:N-acetylglucosamine-6-phosphate deacetylase